MTVNTSNRMSLACWSSEPHPLSRWITAQTTANRRRQPPRNLALATLAFGVGFWAWNIIAPLAASYREDLGLDSTQNSILVAMPVLVGALGRIPVGAPTDGSAASGCSRSCRSCR